MLLNHMWTSLSGSVNFDYLIGQLLDADTSIFSTISSLSYRPDFLHQSLSVSLPTHPTGAQLPTATWLLSFTHEVQWKPLKGSPHLRTHFEACAYKKMPWQRHLESSLIIIIIIIIFGMGDGNDRTFAGPRFSYNRCCTQSCSTSHPIFILLLLNLLTVFFTLSARGAVLETQF